MGEDWMTIFRELDRLEGDLEVVKKYLVEEYGVHEPTEAEIHAERSERFIEGNHIVCPFEGYEELHTEEETEDITRMGVDADSELNQLFGDYRRRARRYYEF